MDIVMDIVMGVAAGVLYLAIVAAAVGTVAVMLVLITPIGRKKRT